VRRGGGIQSVDVGVDAKGAAYAPMMRDDRSVPFRFVKQNVVYLAYIVGRRNGVAADAQPPRRLVAGPVQVLHDGIRGAAKRPPA